MSRLDELIQKYCSNGVEFKSISELGCLFKGMSGVSNKWSDTGNCRFIDYKNAYNNLKINVNNLPFATVKKLENQSILAKGDILFTSASETPNECAISSVIEDDIEEGVFLDDHLFGFRLNRIFGNPVYYNYYFRSDSFRKIVNKTVRGVTRYYISINDFSKIQIPVPPLNVQDEIVRILDTFTELTAELTAELEARKKQYEYYRDEIITSSKETPLVKLGDIATIIRGGNFQKKDFVEDGKQCIHYGQMYTHFGIYADKTLRFVSDSTFDKSKHAKTNDIIMAVTSENVEDVCSCTAWLGEDTIAVSGHTAIIQHNQNAKYLSYYFHTLHFFKQKEKLAHGTKVIEVTPSKLSDVLIPLPSLEEQQRIVDILDRFDALCNDITTGLPAEIKLRQQQYEYYRDKLLAFKPKN